MSGLSCSAFIVIAVPDAADGSRGMAREGEGLRSAVRLRPYMQTRVRRRAVFWPWKAGGGCMRLHGKERYPYRPDKTMPCHALHARGLREGG